MPSRYTFAPDFTPDQLQQELAAAHEGKQSQSLRYWPDDWVNPQDPTGFLQWYSNYHSGRPSPEDEKQKRRWYLVRQRHGAQFAKNPSPRRAMALRNWAIDPLKLLPASKRKTFEAAMVAYREGLEKPAMVAAPEARVTFHPPKPMSVQRAVPRPAAALSTHAAPKSHAAYSQFLWNQENAARTGFDKKQGVWKTYNDRGHPAVGPGIRVPNANAQYSEAQIQAMLAQQIATHQAKARAAVDAAHGAGTFDKLPEGYRYGLTDFYYNGVPAPKLTKAMVAGDLDGIRREHVRFTTDAAGARVPLSRRNQAWWDTFIAPTIAKSSSVRPGAGVLFKNEDDSYMLQLNTEGAQKGKLRPAGGGREEGDDNLRATIIRELGEEFGLEAGFCDDRLRLLGFIQSGEYENCALFEMTDHGLAPAVYQASNHPDEKVTLVRADLGNPLYVGPLPGDLREGESEEEKAAAWQQKIGPVPPVEKSAATMAAPPKSGPNKLLEMLKAIDLDAMEKQALDDIATGKPTKRGPAIKRLAAIQGLRRNNLRPEDLMVRTVPIVPPAFRPFSVAGDVFIPGDANELYRDVFEHRRLFSEVRDKLGDAAAGDARLALYDANRALYGYADPINAKLRSRSVSGFLKKVVGPGSPKFSFPLRKLIGKPQDNVGRSVIIVDPTLGLNEVGIPRSQAWVAFAPHVQRRLVRSGMSPAQAVKHIQDRSELANRALEAEIPERPVVYSRAPAWHKFSVLSGFAKLIDGDSMAINPFVGTGLGADHDGDAMNFHVPATEDSLREAREVLMPSKMLFSIRDPDKIMPAPKHEAVLGLYAAQNRPAQKKWKMKSESEALRAIDAGQIDPDDEIEIG